MAFQQSSVVAALLLSVLLVQTVHPHLILSLLDQLGNVFRNPAWHLFGFVLAVLVYVPLAIKVWHRGGKSDRQADTLAAGSFFVVVALLHSQAGFDSIAEWEIWPIQAYIEGRPSGLSVELISRFWAIIPHSVAATFSPHSFAIYHLLELFMFWGKLTLFYAILRQLGLQPWLAFLAALLFLFYPVNSSLMSIRSTVMTLGKLSLLAGINLILDCRANFSRLHLLGIWLALLLNVGTYETAYAIILVLPAFWWCRIPRQFWRNVNLTVIWYLAPALKAAYLIVLIVYERSFYGSWLIDDLSANSQLNLDTAQYYLDVVATAYRRTFIDGWLEAAHALGQNSWLAATILTLVPCAITGWYLARGSSKETFPSRRQIVMALLGGFLFVLPAIGVLIWFGGFAYGLWRMYVYVPIGGAIVVLSLIALVATLIKNFRLRKAIVIGLSLFSHVPGAFTSLPSTRVVRDTRKCQGKGAHADS